MKGLIRFFNKENILERFNQSDDRSFKKSENKKMRRIFFFLFFDFLITKKNKVWLKFERFNKKNKKSLKNVINPKKKQGYEKIHFFHTHLKTGLEKVDDDIDTLFFFANHLKTRL